MLHKDQSYWTLALDTKISLAGATETKILYQKPISGTRGEWTATVNGTELTYAVQAGNIDESGNWKVQSYAVIGGRKAYGDIRTVYFEQNIKAVAP